MAYISYISYGVAATLSQVVLLRCMMNRFGGNEWQLGGFLFAWLLVTGFGALLGGKVQQRLSISSCFSPILFVFLPSSTALGMMLMELLPPHFGIIEGTTAFPFSTFLVTVLALLPASLVCGALYPALIAVSNDQFEARFSDLSAMDAFGSAVGGFLFATILFPLLDSPALVTVIAFASFLGGIFALRSCPSAKHLPVAIIILFSFFALPTEFFSSPPDTRSGFPVLSRVESRFGLLEVVQRDDQIVLFRGATPVSDAAWWEEAEETAILVLGLHESSRRVFLLEGSSLVARDMATIPDLELVHLQPDSQLTALERTDIAKSAPFWSALRVEQSDPRAWLASHPEESADVILSAINAESLSSSRLSGKEFFALAHKTLSPQGGRVGLLLLGLGKPTNYVSATEAELLLSVLTAAEQHFASCRILPWGRYWLACSDAPIIADPQKIAENCTRRGLKPRRPVVETLSDVWSASRLAELDTRLREARASVTTPNSDLTPVASSFALSLWAARFDSTRLSLFHSLREHKDVLLGFFIIVVVVVLAFSAAFRHKALHASFSAALAGGLGIQTELTLMTVYQSTYGLLYDRIGLFVASYMVGLGLGVWRRKNLTDRPLGHLILWFGVLAVLLLALRLALPFAPSMLHETAFATVASLSLVLVGFLCGRIYRDCGLVLRRGKKSSDEGVAAWLRLLDHAGAALPALLGGVFLLPFFGATVSLSLCASLAGFSLMATWRFRH